jgi:hypothetical protein
MAQFSWGFDGWPVDIPTLYRCLQRPVGRARIGGVRPGYRLEEQSHPLAVVPKSDAESLSPLRKYHSHLQRDALR